MKKTTLNILLVTISFSLMSLIVRHDVADEQFIALGKEYPQIGCPFYKWEAIKN